MAEKLPIDWITIDSRTGWIADDKFVGIKNSFQDLKWLDIRNSPKSVTLSKALVKDTASLVVDQINCILTTSVWDVMAFGSAGNIYISSSWVRQKVYTHSSWYAILGCEEYNWYVYRATLDKLHRTDLTSIADAASSGTLSPSDLDRQTLNWITYSNGLETSYSLDTDSVAKVGMRIYCKNSYNLTAVWVSDGTNAATKAYLQTAPFVASIAANSLRLYTSPQIDPLTGDPVWTERQPIDDDDYNWESCAVCLDWDNMLVSAHNWSVYFSTNAWVGWTAEELWLDWWDDESDSTETMSSTTSINSERWVIILTKKACTLLQVAVKNNVDVAYLRDSWWTLLATAPVFANKAYFWYPLADATNYKITATELWGWFYSAYYKSWGTNFPYVWTNVNFISDETSGSDLRNISGITTGTSTMHTSISDDGVKMIVADEWWRLWLSTDSWANWVETQPDWSEYFVWKFAKISWDWTKYIAWIYWGRLRTSTDGSSWTERQPDWDADKTWQSWMISNDWTNMLVAYNDTWKIYKSVNSWVAWTEVTPAWATTKTWTGIAASDSLCTMVASEWVNIYYSNDYWANRATQSLTDAISWVDCDFNWLIITASTAKRTYQSTNWWTTFTELQPIWALDKTWNQLAISKWAASVETVNVTANVATFSSSLTAGNHYYILFDKEWSTRDPSYKVRAMPVTKTDINYIAWVIPGIDTTKAWVITSIGSTEVNNITHPMLATNLYLYIGDGRYINTVQDTVYDVSSLVLPENEFAYQLTANWSSTRIYAKTLSNDKGRCYFWDWVASVAEQIQTLTWEIKNVVTKESVDYMIMWDDPILYYYPFQKQILKSITDMSSFPFNMEVYKNNLLFGRKWWVYSWGALNKNYPEVLNTEWKTSNMNDTDDISCIHNSDWTLYVAWKNGASYWIDKLSTSTYNTQWEFTNRVYYWNVMWKDKYGVEIYIVSDLLISWESIEIYTQTDLAWWYTLRQTITWPTTDHITKLKLNFKYVMEETKFIMKWPGTSTPEIYEVYFRWWEWQ